jgi:hypothetical protein
VESIDKRQFVEASDRTEVYSSRNIYGLDKKSHEKHKKVSNQWKDLVLAFPIIGNNLSWKVGNGTQVRLGVDSICGMWKCRYTTSR